MISANEVCYFFLKINCQIFLFCSHLLAKMSSCGWIMLDRPLLLPLYVRVISNLSAVLVTQESLSVVLSLLSVKPKAGIMARRP